MHWGYFRTFKYTQTDVVDEVVGTGQPDIKSETDMMKKIFQNKINHLTTENEQLKKDLEEEKEVRFLAFA